MWLLSPSCVTRESRGNLAHQTGSSLCTSRCFFFVSRGSCSWFCCRDLRNVCFPLRLCFPPGRVVLAPGTAQITTSSSQAQPAQTLSPQDCHSCCVLRLFDQLQAVGTGRLLPGWKLCKWQLQPQPPAGPSPQPATAQLFLPLALAHHSNLLSHHLALELNTVSCY